MKSDRMKLIGWWLVYAPILFVCLVLLFAVGHELTVDRSITWLQLVWVVPLFLVVLGGIGWCFGLLLFRETRAALRSIHEDKLRGRCLQCGYLLKGNISGICPECGTPVPRRRHKRASVVTDRMPSKG